MLLGLAIIAAVVSVIYVLESVFVGYRVRSNITTHTVEDTSIARGDKFLVFYASETANKQSKMLTMGIGTSKNADVYEWDRRGLEVDFVAPSLATLIKSDLFSCKAFNDPYSDIRVLTDNDRESLYVIAIGSYREPLGATGVRRGLNTGVIEIYKVSDDLSKLSIIKKIKNGDLLSYFIGNDGVVLTWTRSDVEGHVYTYNSMTNMTTSTPMSFGNVHQNNSHMDMHEYNGAYYSAIAVVENDTYDVANFGRQTLALLKYDLALNKTSVLIQGYRGLEITHEIDCAFKDNLFYATLRDNALIFDLDSNVASYPPHTVSGILVYENSSEKFFVGFGRDDNRYKSVDCIIWSELSNEDLV